MKRILITAAVLATVFACSDAVGELMQDAGVDIADAGDILIDAGEAIVDAGEIVTDAGTVIQDGSVPDASAQGGSGGAGGVGGQGGAVPPAPVDREVTCNHSNSDGSPSHATITIHWAEFVVDPGVTQMTICTPADVRTIDGAWTCQRSIAPYIRGTNVALVECGGSIDYNSDGIIEVPMTPITITVHE